MTTFVEGFWSKLTESVYQETEAKNYEYSSPDEFRLSEFSSEKTPSTVVKLVISLLKEGQAPCWTETNNIFK